MLRIEPDTLRYKIVRLPRELPWRQKARKQFKNRNCAHNMYFKEGKILKKENILEKCQWGDLYWSQSQMFYLKFFKGFFRRNRKEKTSDKKFNFLLKFWAQVWATGKLHLNTKTLFAKLNITTSNLASMFQLQITFP